MTLTQYHFWGDEVIKKGNRKKEVVDLGTGNPAWVEADSRNDALSFILPLSINTG